MPQRLRRRDVLDPRGLEVELREVVVRGERDADEQGAGDEDVERRTPQLLERVKADDAARRDHLPARRRRRVREREAECREHETRHTRRIEGKSRLLGLDAAHEAPESKADEQTGDDPADRSPHANLRKVFLLIGDVMEA